MTKKKKKLIKMLFGLVSDVGNLLSEYDIEWQQSGYFEEAKIWLSKNCKNKFCSLCGDTEELTEGEQWCYKCWKLNSPQAECDIVR